jgi:hypothetical protein
MFVYCVYNSGISVYKLFVYMYLYMSTCKVYINKLVRKSHKNIERLLFSLCDRSRLPGQIEFHYCNLIGISFRFLLTGNTVNRNLQYMYPENTDKTIFKNVFCSLIPYVTPIKKKKKFSSYIRKSDRIGCKVIYEEELPNIWGNAQIFNHIWLCNRSLLLFSFLSCSVH